MSNPTTTIQGDPQNNLLNASGTASVLRGLGGADSLTGSASNDVLIGDDVLVIRANSTMVAGILPDVRITINDPSVAVDSFTVNNTGFADYYIPFAIPGGTTKVDIIFRNGVGPYNGQNMSLTVDSFTYGDLVFRAPAGTSWVKTIHQGLSLTFTAPAVVAGNDTLDGGAGADTMLGGAGDDVYLVDDLGDVVREASNEGQDTVISQVSYALSRYVENLTLTGSQAFDATGNELANQLTGNDNNNRMNGLEGNDTMVGGKGDDTYVVDALLDSVVEQSNEGNDTVESLINFSLADKPSIENITLLGSTFIDAAGNTGNNRLEGNAGDNKLTGNGGTDTLVGGEGNDYYVVDSADDTVLEEGDVDLLGNPRQGGIDTIESSVSLSLGSHVENLTLTGSAVEGHGNDLDNTIIGNALGNQLSGGKGNDLLAGGKGLDTMTGNEGDDTYEIDRLDDVIIELADEGTDTVVSTVSFDLSSLANVENLQLAGTANLDAIGDEKGNVISGNDGYSYLYGMGGNDTLIGLSPKGAWLEGGQGDDVYIVRGNTTYIYEEAGQGHDSVSAEGSNFYWLNDDIEDASISAAGLGNAVLTLVGNEGANRLTGSFNADRIYGSDGEDTLIGGFGNDTLDGGCDADSMVGGIGNDTYVVDNPLDAVLERANEGTDVVIGDVSVDISAWLDIENLSLRGAQALNGRGNRKSNTITGNQMDNTLWGGDGNDLIDGGSGDDDLYGDAGNDTLIAGQGNDVLHGSSGQDTYRVNLLGSGNTELAIDVEDGDVLELTGVTDKSQLRFTRVVAQTGWGDTHADWTPGAGSHVRIASNTGNDGVVFQLFQADGQAVNRLSQIKVGGAVLSMSEILSALNTAATDGDDSLYGFNTNDTIDGGRGNDFLDGGAGIDQLLGGMGNDTLKGTGMLSGGSGDDMLSGTGLLDGGEGNDQLILVGNTASTVMGGAGDDHIHSYNWDLQTGSLIRGGSGNDVIRLGRSDVGIHAMGDGIDIMSGSSSSTIRLEGIKLSELALSRQLYGDQLILGVKADLALDQMRVSDYFSTPSWGQNAPSMEVLNETGTAYSTLSAAQILAATSQGNDLDNWLIDTTGNDTILGGGGQDVIQGTTGNDSLFGGEGDDTISDEIGSNTLLGEAGNDILQGNLAGWGSMSGGEGQDTLRGNGLLDGGTGGDLYEVRFTADNINRVIHDHDSGAGQIDTLDLDGVTPYELWFQQQGQDLRLTRINTNSTLVIQNWFLGACDQIETIQAHGQRPSEQDTWVQGSLQSAQVQSLVSLMAGMPMQPEQTSITHAVLRGAIEQAWQLTTFTGNNSM